MIAARVACRSSSGSACRTRASGPKLNGAATTQSRSQYGGTIGGPLKKDVTHYFANYEDTTINDASVVTSVLGFGFWIVAARLYPARVVGRDGALIAGLIELSAISQLNLANAITRFLPRLRSRAASALRASYLLSALGAILIGTAFVVVAPLISHDLRVVMRPMSIAAVYVVSLVVWGPRSRVRRTTIEDGAGRRDDGEPVGPAAITERTLQVVVVDLDRVRFEHRVQVYTAAAVS